MHESMTASLAQCRHAAETGSTPLQASVSFPERIDGALREGFERDDRQMLAPRAVLDAQFEYDSGPSANKRVRSGARRPARPTLSRLVSWPAASWEPIEVDLVRRTG